MTMLVLSLLFNARPKPSDDDTCSCVGTGLDRKCGCVPYAFIAQQGIIFAGVSIAAVSLVRLMGTHHHGYGWMRIAILMVVIAYIWNGVVITPYKYRCLLVAMYVVIIVSMMGCGLIWLYIKAASQFLGVGIIHLWQGTKTTLWQLGQACKIFVSTVKNEACSTIFGAPPDPEQEPLV